MSRNHIFNIGFTIANILLALFVIWVIPQYSQMLSGFGADLPALTMFVISYMKYIIVWPPIVSILLNVMVWKGGNAKKLDKGMPVLLLIEIVLLVVSFISFYSTCFDCDIVV